MFEASHALVSATDEVMKEFQEKAGVHPRPADVARLDAAYEQVEHGMVGGGEE